MAEPTAHAHSPSDLLTLHLREQLGVWPPTKPVEVTTSRMRTSPGWNGVVVPFYTVTSPSGSVVSVPPDMVPEARALLGEEADRLDLDVLARIARHATRRTGSLGTFVLRRAAEEVLYTGPDVGVWLKNDDPLVPDWLRKYNGDVLVVLDNGVAVATCARKRHDQWAQELMADTLPEYRGRGYARALMAQAARVILAQGALPTTVYRTDNAASIKVNDSLGFLDLGLRTLEWEFAPSIRQRVHGGLSRVRKVLSTATPR